MKRITGLKSHLNIEKLLSDIGMLSFQNNEENKLCWSDNVAYELHIDEIEYLEHTTNELLQICLASVEQVINNNHDNCYNLSSIQKEIIKRDWKNQSFILYGNFNLISTIEGLVLESFNFNNPKFLIESSILQWKWLEQLKNNTNKDQYNWIHQAIINHLTFLKKEKGNLYLIDDDSYHTMYFKDLLDISEWDLKKASLITSHTITQERSSEWFHNHTFLEYMLEKDIYLFEPAWSKLLSSTQFIQKIAQIYKFPLPINTNFLKQEQHNSKQAILTTWTVGQSACGLAIKEKSIENGKTNYKIAPHYFVE